MNDAVLIGLVFVGLPLVIIAFVSWILHYFVALNAPPTQRAGWTVGIAYFLASALWLFGGPEGDRWEGPFAAIPGALIAFWFWRNDFGRDWLDDAKGVPEGVELANSDWRIGLLGVAMLIAFAALKMVIRRASTGQ
jgi:hypothetical protein